MIESAKTSCQRDLQLQHEDIPLLTRLAKILNIIILFQLIIPAGLMAVESAPDISDREIVEKLSLLGTGQKTLDQRITNLRSEMKSGQEALNTRISDMNYVRIALFGAIITLIVALFVYIT